VEADRHFCGAYCFHHHHPDHGGSKHDLTIGQLLRDYTLQCPRRLPSHLLLRKPEISLNKKTYILLTGFEYHPTYQK
jgi:hypothetical protein